MLKGGGPEENAERLKALLMGYGLEAETEVVALNAGALLMTAVVVGVGPRLWRVANAHDQLPVTLPEFQPLSQRSYVYDVKGKRMTVHIAAEFLFIAGQAYRESGRIDQAREVYSSIMQTFPDSDESHYRERARMELDSLRASPPTVGPLDRVG